MKITWLGHSGFRLEIAGEVLLIDPWLAHPLFPEGREEEATQGASHILITHGHGDHTGGVPALAKTLGATVAGPFDLMEYWERSEVLTVVGFMKGGTIRIGDVAVTMVAASHSSSLDHNDPPVYAGSPVGYMIEGEGHTIYISGDTDIMADMEWMGELYAPDIGILCAGGHFTMDMARAAWAANRYFDFKTVIPCHYRTFDALEQSADRLRADLAGVDVRTPGVMETIEI